MSKPSRPAPDRPMLEMRCNKCGESVRRLMLLAMMMDAGAHVHPSPLACDHDFAEKGTAPCSTT